MDDVVGCAVGGREEIRGMERWGKLEKAGAFARGEIELP
jgi:hypothetical protein